MQIEEVIKRHGMEFRDVSRQMGLKPSGLQNAIDRNLTIGTLRKIAEAINAINEENKRADRCYLAEFFADELPAGFTLTSSGTEEAPKTEASSADDLPFDNSQPSVQMQQAIICPHCKKAMTITVQA